MIIDHALMRSNKLQYVLVLENQRDAERSDRRTDRCNPRATIDGVNTDINIILFNVNYLD